METHAEIIYAMYRYTLTVSDHCCFEHSRVYNVQLQAMQCDGLTIASSPGFPSTRTQTGKPGTRLV